MKIGLLTLYLLMFTLVAGNNPSNAREHGSQPYSRIVSLSPAVTEVLFEFNLGDRVVGVTRHCAYPPESRMKTSIGGLLDPNFEVIYRLNPDLVVYNEGATSHKPQFAKMQLNTLEVESTSVEGILKSIDKIGRLFDETDRSSVLREKITNYMNFVRAKTLDLAKPRVLITYWRQLGEGQITEAFTKT